MPNATTADSSESTNDEAIELNVIDNYDNQSSKQKKKNKKIKAKIDEN